MIPAVFVIDTSYLLELFKVPDYSQHPEEIKKLFEMAIQNQSRFYVPLPCVFELGNHIADVRDGTSRFKLGKKLYNTICSCINNNRPWNITPSAGLNDLPDLCKNFSEQFVKQRVGLTDTFIIREAHRLKKKYNKSDFKVHIWTKDIALKAQEPDTEKNQFVG